MLRQIYDSQKAFGKPVEDFKTLNRWFRLLLGEYTLEAVQNALKRYCTEQSDIPTPADILKILSENQDERQIYIDQQKKLWWARNKDPIWRQVGERFCEEHGDGIFVAWFCKFNFDRLEGQTIHLLSPLKFTATEFIQRYGEDTMRIYKILTGVRPSIKITIDKTISVDITEGK